MYKNKNKNVGEPAKAEGKKGSSVSVATPQHGDGSCVSGDYTTTNQKNGEISMNNEVKTLDGMDEKIKAAAWVVYDKAIKRMAETLTEEEYRCAIACAFLTRPEFEYRLKNSTNRERINYVFMVASHLEDSDDCMAVLTKFCEDIGLSYDEGYNIYIDVERKGY